MVNPYEIRQALRQPPPEDDFLKVGRWKSYALTRRAQKILHSGQDWNEAKRLLKDALRIDPASHDVRVNLGTVLVNTSRPGDPAYQWGLEQLHLARDRTSAPPATYWDSIWYTSTYRLVDAYFALGDYPRSEQLAEELRTRIDAVLAELHSPWPRPFARSIRAARGRLEEYLLALSPAVTVMHAATLVCVGKVGEGCGLVKEIEEAGVRSGLPEYNLACFYSILAEKVGVSAGNADEALRHLCVAVQIGDAALAKLARTDRCLLALRTAKPEEFEKCLGTA